MLVINKRKDSENDPNDSARFAPWIAARCMVDGRRCPDRRWAWFGQAKAVVGMVAGRLCGHIGDAQCLVWDLYS